MRLKSRFINQSGVGAIVLLILLSLIAGSVVIFKKKNPAPATTPSNVPSSEVSAPGTPVLSFTSDPASPGPNENFDLILKANPDGTEFHAFEFYVSYDPEKVDFQIQEDLSQNISSAYPLIISAVDSNSQKISIVGTRTGSPFAGSEALEIARVKMKSKSGSGGGLVFSWGEGTKLGNKIPFQKLDFNL